MTHPHTFTAVYQHDGDWWIGWIEELPGAIAQEHTLDEARESLREVIPLILEARREVAHADAQGVPQIREALTVSLGSATA